MANQSAFPDLTYRQLAAYLLAALLCLLAAESDAGQIGAQNQKVFSGLAFDAAAEGLPLPSDDEDQHTQSESVAESFVFALASSDFPVRIGYSLHRGPAQPRAPPVIL